MGRSDVKQETQTPECNANFAIDAVRRDFSELHAATRSSLEAAYQQDHTFLVALHRQLARNIDYDAMRRRLILDDEALERSDLEEHEESAWGYLCGQVWGTRAKLGSLRQNERAFGEGERNISEKLSVLFS